MLVLVLVSLTDGRAGKGGRPDRSSKGPSGKRQEIRGSGRYKNVRAVTCNNTTTKMHYIRFLKLPRCTTEHGTLEVHALITVASDLGESFFPDAFTLRAQAICGEKVHASKTFEWDGSMRSLKIQMRITQKLASPFLLKLTALDINDKAPRQAEGVAILPIILDAWSGLVDPRGKLDVEKMVERRFTFDDKEELRIWEETGESLARHLWSGFFSLAAAL